MALISDNTTVEKILTQNTLVTVPTITATSAAGTLTLTVASVLAQILTGTAAGYSVALPDATTLANGHRYEIYNTSTQSIALKNNAGTTLSSLPFNSNTDIILQSNSTAAGVWVFTTRLGSSSTISAITFGRSGGTAAGAYLSIGNVLTSTSGYLINGNNIITGLSVSSGVATAAAKTATFRLQRRSAVNTFVDISGTDITIAAVSYTASVTGLSVAIGPNWEICAYRINPDAGGADVSDVVLNAFIAPA